MRSAAYEYLPTDDEHWQKAFAAQRDLARSGSHRAIGIADLLTAVIAAEHRLTLVHYNADFETAATMLAFDSRWVGLRGSLWTDPATFPSADSPHHLQKNCMGVERRTLPLHVIRVARG